MHHVAAGAVFAAGTPHTALPPVVVSAAKQPTSLDALNGGAAIVSATELDSHQVRDTADLDRVLPGLYTSQGGSLLYPIVTLRGVTSAQDLYNPAVTVYVDGVPQMPVFTYQALTDIEQAELLKGPQGTVYGRSAQGGVLGITSHRPGPVTTAYASGGISSYGGYNGKVSASGAIASGLYGSLTALTQNQPGQLRSPSTGSDNLGGSRSDAGAARLRLAPEGSPWEVNLALSGECTSGWQDVYVPFDATGARTIVAAPGTPDPKLRRCGNSESIGATYRGAGWALSAIAAWQNVHFSRMFAYGPMIVNQPERWRQDVQEIRLTTQGSKRAWDGVAGLYRHNMRQSRTSAIDVMPAATVSDNRQEALAAYANGTWHVTPTIDLGAGLRLSHDSARTQVGQSPSATAARGNRTSQTSALGELSAGYQLAPAWRVYARIAQGYKPGGFNLAPAGTADTQPFEAERSVSYELGTRYHAGRLAASGALFDTVTRDMQLYAGPVGMQTIRNAGRSNAYGAEFDVRAQVSPQWKVGLAGYLNRATFTAYGNPQAGTDLSGNLVPYVPRYGLTLDVAGDIATRIGRVLPGIAVRLNGPQYFDAANTLRQPTYALVDLRLAWRPHKRLELGAYALNLFDRVYRTQAFQAGPSMGGALASVGPGRIVGLDMRWDML